MMRLPVAEALFGSQIRGDNDVLSDRDVLIVDDNPAVLHARQAAAELQGYSVASYTFLKLEALARKGALFIQHLKDEALIVRDEGGRLGQLLLRFRPKQSYDYEIWDNARLGNLAAIYPATRIGAIWAADILYVTMRNFGILVLAQRGVFLFSYPRILDALAEASLISKSAIPALLELRWAKSAYRSRKPVSLNAATEIITRAAEVLPDLYFPTRLVGVPPIDLLRNASELEDGAAVYHKLRNIERAYVALLASNPSTPATSSLVRLNRWIENPRVYAPIAGALEPELIADIRNSQTRLAVAGAIAGRALMDPLRDAGSQP
jgi:predicted nucleotidyltransferase